MGSCLPFLSTASAPRVGSRTPGSAIIHFAMRHVSYKKFKREAKQAEKMRSKQARLRARSQARKARATIGTLTYEPKNT
jgi:hypothetical protein